MDVSEHLAKQTLGQTRERCQGPRYCLKLARRAGQVTAAVAKRRGVLVMGPAGAMLAS